MLASYAPHKEMAKHGPKRYVHSMKRFPLNLTLRSFSFAYVTGIALALAQPAYAGASEGDSLQDVWSILIELMIVIA